MAIAGVDEMDASLGQTGDEDPNEAGENILAEAAAMAEMDDEDEEDEEGVEVSETLKDAVHGSFRLKRLLSRDEDTEESPGKKRRPEESEKDVLIQKILKKWGLVGDAVVKHVLDTNTMEELQAHDQSVFCPDKFNQWKSVPEQVSKYCSEYRERKMCIGGPLDQASLFRHRWKLTMEQDKKVRALTHKELRYVLSAYDGKKNLDDVVEEAVKHEADKLTAETAMPDAPGVITVGRLGRLELIDSLADAATFGDANLTFSLKLAKHRQALGHAGRVIATTFEELDTLRERYAEVEGVIKQLEDEFYAEVYHGVDCTRIAIDKRFLDFQGKLGAVYYNFPHSGAIQGFFDGHPVVNWRHENLMRLFFRALRSFTKPGGVVKVSSNSGAIGVRYSYIVSSAEENEFVHVETVPFLEWCLHRYGRSYGDRRDSYKRPDAVNNQSYNAQSADRDMVYCFRFEPSGKSLEKQQVRLPPTLKTIAACEDGPFRGLQGTARTNLAKMLHKRFITEVSGTHVG